MYMHVLVIIGVVRARGRQIACNVVHLLDNAVACL